MLTCSFSLWFASVACIPATDWWDTQTHNIIGNLFLFFFILQIQFWSEARSAIATCWKRLTFSVPRYGIRMHRLAIELIDLKSIVLWLMCSTARTCNYNNIHWVDPHILIFMRTKFVRQTFWTLARNGTSIKAMQQRTKWNNSLEKIEKFCHGILFVVVVLYAVR